MLDANIDKIKSSSLGGVKRKKLYWCFRIFFLIITTEREQSKKFPTLATTLPKNYGNSTIRLIDLIVEGRNSMI